MSKKISIFLYSNNSEEGELIKKLVEGQKYEDIEVIVISTQKISWLLEEYDKLSVAERTRAETEDLKKCIEFSRDITDKDYYVVNFNKDFEVKPNDKMISIYSEIVKNEVINFNKLKLNTGISEAYIKDYLLKKASEREKENVLKARSILYMDVYHEGHFFMYTYQINGIIPKKAKANDSKSILEIFVPIKKNKNKEQKSFFELSNEEKKYFNSKEKAIEVLLNEINNI